MGKTDLGITPPGGRLIGKETLETKARLFTSFPSLGKESCLGHLGLPGKGVTLLGTGHVTCLCSLNHLPTPFHTSGVSLVGVGEQEPHLYLPCVPAELSAALQVPSEVGTAVGSLGRWTEISSLDCLFLGNGKIANSFCSAVSWASQQPTPCRQRLPSPAESWEGQGRWADNSHSPGPSWTRYS